MLSANRIKMAMKAGDIVIDPFNEDNLQPNSYDITIGSYIYHRRGGEFFRAYPTSRLPSREIVMPPQSFVLVNSEETFGTVKKYTAQLTTKSTAARHGLSVIGGFGDIGYVNRWGIVIANLNTEAIAIAPGMKIAQVYFTEVQGASTKTYAGQYNAKEGVNWKPEDMLPREWVSNGA